MSYDFRRQNIYMENKTKIKQFLTKVGLDEKETSVYLYLLSKGPQHVSILAKACGLTRTNGYDIIKKLEEKGLCYNQGSLYGKKIKANSPSRLQEILKQKEVENNKLKDTLSDILPLFKNIEPEKNIINYNVYYFKGEESLKKLINMSLQEKKLIRWAGSELDLIDKLGEDFVIHFHNQRVDKNIHQRLILPGNKRGGNNLFKKDKEYLREVKVRPEGEIRLKSNIIIWDKYIAFFSTKDEMFGTLIENEPLSIMLSSWFDLVWNISN